MNYYIIVEINITDDSWVPEYIQEVTRLIGQHGGRYLARTPNLQRLEGERALPQIVALIEFPSQEALQAWYSSAEYQPYLQQRLRGASTELTVVPGEDFAQG
jgi:uncharacterized protein (DUF1330 family)